jgi:hypothetical protein
LVHFGHTQDYAGFWIIFLPIASFKFYLRADVGTNSGDPFHPVQLLAQIQFVKEQSDKKLKIFNMSLTIP